MTSKGPAIVCIIAALSCSVSAKTETYSRRGYQLTFNDTTDAFSATTQKRMVDTFFTVYPKIVRTFNRAAPKKVTFMVNPKMPCSVAASGFRSLVSLNPKYFANHPNDIDVITHECMHLAQAYNWTSGSIPGWATEGIADYVRYTMGVDNGSAGWSLPEFKESQKLTDSYRVAARFFSWIEKNVKPGFVRAFDKALRNGTSNGFFKRVTGNTEEELWAQYAQNPKI